MCEMRMETSCTFRGAGGVHEEGGQQQRQREDSRVVCVVGRQGADALGVNDEDVDGFAVLSLAGDDLGPYPKAFGARCSGKMSVSHGMSHQYRRQQHHHSSCSLTSDSWPHSKAVAAVQQDTVHQERLAGAVLANHCNRGYGPLHAG